MTPEKPVLISTPAKCVDAVIEKVGQKIVLGLPLGLGKANHFVNALFARAMADASIDLTIFTALTLERPTPKSDIERRFVGPINERLFGGTIDLVYAKAVRANSLPANIKVHEFFLTPGNWLNSARTQRDYISLNYTHGARTLVQLGVNVIAQMIAKRDDGQGPRYSLSCNTDVTLDVASELERRDTPLVMIGEVNANLPFMPNDAEMPAEFFDFLLTDPALDHRLFAPPKTPVTLADYAAGFHAASLVKDGGTLQIGIGSLGDAICYALILRQQHNEIYRNLLDALGDGAETLGADIAVRETGLFKKGIHGASEMLVDGFLHLIDARVLKRRVYPTLAIQTLLNAGRITEKITPQTVRELYHAGAVSSPLSNLDVENLVTWGVFSPAIRFANNKVIAPRGQNLSADISNPANLAKIASLCLGDKLKGGVVIHGGFFLGPEDFYHKLSTLPDDKLNAINMTAVSFINQLYGDEALKSAQRTDARFINTAMMVTLQGGVVSDGLENGRIVSGVGGQYDFVAQAHALQGARSVITLRSTRTRRGKTKSNILWDYGHITIPRHLRDIVVTEYGVADLRGKSDRDIVAALLNIADSRFQQGLLHAARKNGKIEQGYQIPKQYCANTPSRLTAMFAPAKQQGLFGAFPFGTALTPEEITLGAALRWLEAGTATKTGTLKLMVRALIKGGATPTTAPLLKRMDLDAPETIKDRLTARLIAYALKITTKGK